MYDIDKDLSDKTKGNCSKYYLKFLAIIMLRPVKITCRVLGLLLNFVIYYVNSYSLTAGVIFQEIDWNVCYK